MFRQTIFSTINKAEFSIAVRIIGIVINHLLQQIEKNFPSKRGDEKLFEFKLFEVRKLKITLASVINNLMGKEGYKIYQSSTEDYKTYFCQTIANEYLKLIGLTEIHCKNWLAKSSPVVISSWYATRWGTIEYYLKIKDTTFHSIEKLQPLLAGIFAKLKLELVLTKNDSYFSLLNEDILSIANQFLLFGNESSSKEISANETELVPLNLTPYLNWFL